MLVAEAVRKAGEVGDLLDALARRFEPKLRAAFLASVAAIREAVDMEDLRAAVDRADVEGVLRVLGIGEGGNVTPFDRLRTPLQELWQQVGRQAYQDVPLSRLDMHFDLTSPRTVRTLQNQGANLIREVSDETRDGVRAIMSRQLYEGVPPRAVAAEIGRMVGLTRRQAVAVQNYRRALEERDAKALTMAHRDKRYDGGTRAHINRTRNLSAARIDEMVERYRQRAIAHRGETIAITESMRAVTLANHAAIRQAIDAGTVPEAAVRRFWNVARDERTCPVCIGIAKVNKAGVEMEKPFRLEKGGTIMTSPAHPRCRCPITFQLDV